MGELNSELSKLAGGHHSSQKIEWTDEWLLLEEVCQILEYCRCTGLECFSVSVYIPTDRTLPLRLQSCEHDDD